MVYGEQIRQDCPECFAGELIRDHLVDMEFIAFNQHGRIINPPPRPGSDSSSRKDLYNIRSVDVRLTFRSKKKFYRFDKLDAEGKYNTQTCKRTWGQSIG